jgi:hypothetical protein
VSDTSDDDGPDGDPDEDSFDNDDEYSYGTSPTSADSDGDGLIDGSTTQMPRSDSRFKLWESQGIQYKTLPGYQVKFLGETTHSTNRTNPDSDSDNATDGQELYGYNVMISWFEGEDLKSMNKTVYGHPWGAYKEPDNNTYLDVDGDGITDIDEIDPANSTTQSVTEFMEHFKNNQEMLDGQFNPFIRESTPPVVINIKVKTHENWETVWVGFIPIPVLKRAWAEIDIEAIDVAKFTVTAKISPGRIAHFEGEGHEWFKAELDLTFWEIAGRYKVRIEMVDFAGNELDPPYEEEVDGWFGGVLRMLEALWDFIVAVVSAIAEAVMAALSFIVDWIVGLVTDAINSALAPIYSAIDSWMGNAREAVDETFEENSLSLAMTNSLLAGRLIFDAFAGGAFDLIVAVALAIILAITAISYFLNVFGFLFGLLLSLIMSVVLLALVGGSATGDPQVDEAQALSPSALWITDTSLAYIEWDQELGQAFAATIFTLISLSLAVPVALRWAGAAGAMAATAFVVSIFSVWFGAFAADTTSYSDEERELYRGITIVMSVVGLLLSIGSVIYGGMKREPGAVAIGGLAIVPALIAAALAEGWIPI